MISEAQEKAIVNMINDGSLDYNYKRYFIFSCIYEFSDKCDDCCLIDKICDCKNEDIIAQFIYEHILENNPEILL